MNAERGGRPLPLVVLTAGGTGGHVFPAEALAAELLARGHRLALITDRRGQAFGGTLGSLATHRVRAGGIAGRGLAARVKAAADLGLGFLQARLLLARLRPSVVVGFGGYASLPGMMAAELAGIPSILHEQNAVLGRANRLLARRVSRITTSFAEVGLVAPAWTPKLIRTGMPVRPAIQPVRDIAYAPPADGEPLRILVLGGSQGATVLSEVVPAAVARLPEALQRRLVISQQCRPADIDEARAAYAETVAEVTLATFFHDVPERLAAAHLVIARSGASTVAELTVTGRPAVLVPYPHAIDDHQTANAHAVAEAGGAWLFPQASFTAEALKTRIEDLIAMPDNLVRAAACARAVGIPDAAGRLADVVQGLLSMPPENVS